MSATAAVLAAKQAERDQSVDFVDRTLESVAAENRDLSDAERRQLDHHKEIMERLDVDIRSLGDFLKVAESAVQIDSRIRTTPRPTNPVGYVTPQYDPAFRTLGELYVTAEGFETRGALGTRCDLPDANPYDIAVQTRAVLTTGTPPGSDLVPNPLRWTPGAPAFTTPLLDAIPKVPVTTNSVDIVVVSEFSGAGVVPEGADKPEETFTTTVTPTPLETIAGWVQYSRQLAQDAPAVTTLINNGLTRDILRKLNAEIQSAIAAASIPTTTGAAGVSAVGVVRQAMAEIETAGFSPSAVLGSPADMASLDMDLLALGGASAATYGGGVWGLQRIPVPGLAELYVFDLAAALVLFQRTGVEVYTTDSDITGTGASIKSAFRANVLTTLAETRAKGAVVNTAAARELALTPAP
jgi:HK97 family phage major capsid protein